MKHIQSFCANICWMPAPKHLSSKYGMEINRWSRKELDSASLICSINRSCYILVCSFPTATLTNYYKQWLNSTNLLSKSESKVSLTALSAKWFVLEALGINLFPCLCQPAYFPWLKVPYSIFKAISIASLSFFPSLSLPWSSPNLLLFCTQIFFCLFIIRVLWLYLGPTHRIQDN